MKVGVQLLQKTALLLLDKVLTVREGKHVFNMASRALTVIVKRFGVSEGHVRALTNAELSSRHDKALMETKNFINDAHKPGDAIFYTGVTPLDLRSKVVASIEIFGKEKHHRALVVAAPVRVVYLGDDIFAFMTSDGWAYVVDRESVCYK